MTQREFEVEDIVELMDLAEEFCYAAMSSHYATDVGLQESERELGKLLDKLSASLL